MIDNARISEISGKDVYDRTGSKIGSAGEVYLDDATEAAEWVTVRTGLFGTKESFVPLREAELTEDGVRVAVTKDAVKEAPKVEPDGHLSPAEERELYGYYGFTYEPPRTRTVGEPVRTERVVAEPARTEAVVEPTRTDAAAEPAAPAGDVRLRRYVAPR